MHHSKRKANVSRFHQAVPLQAAPVHLHTEGFIHSSLPMHIPMPRTSGLQALGYRFTSTRNIVLQKSVALCSPVHASSFTKQPVRESCTERTLATECPLSCPQCARENN